VRAARWNAVFIVSYASIRTRKTFNTILHRKISVSRSFCFVTAHVYYNISRKSHIPSRYRTFTFINETPNVYTEMRYPVDSHPPMTTASVRTTRGTTVFAVSFPSFRTGKTLHTILNCKITVSRFICFLMALLYNSIRRKIYITSRDSTFRSINKTSHYYIGRGYPVDSHPPMTTTSVRTARWNAVFIISYASIRTRKTFNTILHRKITVSSSFCHIVALLYNSISRKSHIPSRYRAFAFIDKTPDFYTEMRYPVDSHPPMATASMRTSRGTSVLVVSFPSIRTSKTLNTILNCKITVCRSSCSLAALVYNNIRSKSHKASRDCTFSFINETPHYFIARGYQVDSHPPMTTASVRAARWNAVFVVSYASVRTRKTFNTILHRKITVSRSFCFIVALLYNTISRKSHIPSRYSTFTLIDKTPNFNMRVAGIDTCAPQE